MTAGDCGVKLSAPEMEQVRAPAAAAGAEWRPAVQAAFRAVMLARAQAYRDGGLAFLYWSKETLGTGKPIVSITHVAIFSHLVERRIRADAPALLDAMRRKLEHGEPPIVGGTE